MTLGQSWGESLQCDGDKADGYDDAFSATQVWRAFRNHTVVKPELKQAYEAAHPPTHQEQEENNERREPEQEPEQDEEVASRRKGGGGSCECSCPPGQGHGFCFAMPEGTPPNDAGCDAVLHTAPLYVRKPLPALVPPLACPSFDFFTCCSLCLPLRACAFACASGGFG